jgi:hypothetical protein
MKSVISSTSVYPGSIEPTRFASRMRIECGDIGFNVKQPGSVDHVDISNMEDIVFPANKPDY